MTTDHLPPTLPAVQVTPEEIAALLRTEQTTAETPVLSARQVIPPAPESRSPSKKDRVAAAWAAGTRAYGDLCAAADTTKGSVSVYLAQLRAERRIHGEIERKGRVAKPATGKPGSGPSVLSAPSPPEPEERPTTGTTTTTPETVTSPP